MPTHPVAVNVADEVRAAMARRRLSQTKLAKAMGMSQPAMNRRIRGEIPFDVVELTAIAKILDVPVTTFLPEPVSAA